MVYGYCRCSTNETKQDINRQVRELKALGVLKENIFKEYVSGSKDDRCELNRLLTLIKEGDTIIATEVSRITRSTKQLCSLLDLAKNKKLKLIFGSFVVDCTKELDAMTQGMLQMMGVFAELERNIISQRVKSGVANARSKGKQIGRPINNKGSRYPSSVQKFSNGNNKSVHPTQKPVDLLEYLIKTYTNEGETVLDNCMGSGTTGVACVNTNRNFIGIELDDKYFEIAKERIERHEVQIGMELNKQVRDRKSR